MSLQRGEGPHARALLIQIAQAFPQAIYYSLRTMVLCLREFAFKVVQVTVPAPLAQCIGMVQPCTRCWSVPAVYKLMPHSDSVGDRIVLMNNQEVEGQRWGGSV